MHENEQFYEKKIKMTGGSIQKRGCRSWLPLGSKKKVRECIYTFTEVGGVEEP